MSFNIIVKTLNGKQLPLAIESSWTTQQIKEAIEKEHAMPADTLKLIAYGKVLNDQMQKDKDGPTVEGTAETYNLKEGDFVVAMTQKAKPKPKAPAAEPTPVVAPVTAPDAAPVAAPQVPVPAPVTQAPVVVPQPSVAAITELPPMTEDQKTMLTMVKELTACNDDIGERALRAVNFIPDTAYALIQEAPHQIPTMAQLLEAANHPSAQGGDGGGEPYGEEDDYGQEGAGGGADAGGQPGGPIDLSQMGLSAEVQQQIHALMANPSFPMIRQRMQQDQNFATQFLAQLAQTQPQIAQAIQQNPQLLFALVLGHNPMAGMAGAGGGPGAAGGGQQQPPPGSIQVSPQEMEDINTLVSYGFPKQRAAEAYLACDKNIEQAANFLFEAGADDDDTAMQQAMLASQQEASGAGAANPQPDAAAATQPPAEGGAPDNNNNNNEGGAGGDAGAGGDTGAGAGGDAGAGAGGDAGAGGSSLA